MAKSNKNTGPEARLPKGFRDTAPDELRETSRMLGIIRRVYESYGFEPLETPAIEYTDALGKFLPDQDRPNEGVFSFQDEDEQWLSLRYDLTAPLARYVAENFERLPKPFRRYAVGPVWRNEKPGPGRFRQFTQFDADTVGTDNIAADAEICMLAADTMEALGIKRGDYVIKVSNRKVLDGLMESIGLGGDEGAGRRLTVLRAIDKLDRLKDEGVRLLLGRGRKDESGDFTKGAELTDEQIHEVMTLIGSKPDPAGLRDVLPDWELADSIFVAGSAVPDPTGNLSFRTETFTEPGPNRLAVSNAATIKKLRAHFSGSDLIAQGLNELEQIAELARAGRYGTKRIRIDPSVVRGLEYYTGPVFEAEITVPVVNEDGQTVRFGSVGGGGRYDGLVERFLGTKVPATGFSIGVSRLQAALAAINKDQPAASDGPVVVLVMDKADLPRFQKMAQTLRGAGIRAEMYLGSAGMKAQMKYADKRGAPCVVIQGGDEHNAPGGPMVQIKDLVEGAKASATIKDSKEWRESRPAQVSVPEADLVTAVRELLARHRG
jgi:histidyl-tRNA synthetase